MRLVHWEKGWGVLARDDYRRILRGVCDKELVKKVIGCMHGWKAEVEESDGELVIRVDDSDMGDAVRVIEIACLVKEALVSREEAERYALRLCKLSEIKQLCWYTRMLSARDNRGAEGVRRVLEAFRMVETGWWE